MEFLLRHELNHLAALHDDELISLKTFGTGALQGSCYDAPYKRWAKQIPARQLLLVQSERLFRKPSQQLARVIKFLGLEQDLTKLLSEWRHLNMNRGLAEIISSSLRSDLECFFTMHSTIYFKI